MYKLYWSLWCFFVFMGTAFAQTDSVAQKPVQYDERTIEPIQFDRDLIDDLKHDSDFDYTRTQGKTLWELFTDWLKNWWGDFMEWIFGDLEAGGTIAFILKILPYVILGILLALTVWLFMKVNPGSALLRTRESPKVNLSEEEEIIKNKDISELIAQAIQQEDFRLAVRYYYLLTLKNLREMELIDYQFEKTNTEYLSELKSEDLTRKFRRVTHLYDFIWYGDFEVSEGQFKQAQNEFEEINERLDRKKAS